ncbi:hypothetical protein ACB098_02G100700 [Castanea mollissima]
MGASSSSWESSYLNSTSGLLSLLDLNPNYLNQDMDEMDFDQIVDVPDTPDRLAAHHIIGKESAGRESNSSLAGHLRNPDFVGDKCMNGLRGRGRLANDNNFQNKRLVFRSRKNLSDDEPMGCNSPIIISPPQNSYASQNAHLFRRPAIDKSFSHRSRHSIGTEKKDKGKGVSTKFPPNSSGFQEGTASLYLTEQSGHTQKPETGFPLDAFEDERKEQIPTFGGSSSYCLPVPPKASSNAYKGKEKLEDNTFKSLALAHGKGAAMSTEKQVSTPVHCLTMPRVSGQKRLVRNGCISPHNIATRAKQLAEQQSTSSNVDLVSKSPPLINISDIVSGDNNGDRVKGKGVMNLPSANKSGANIIHITGSPVIDNGEADGHNNASRDAFALPERLRGWRSTRSRSKKNDNPLSDAAGCLSGMNGVENFVSQQHENRAERRDTGSGINCRAQCDVAKDCDAAQTAAEIVSDVDQIAGPHYAPNTLSRRQKKHRLTSRNRGECSASVTDDSDIVILGSYGEPSNSRSSRIQTRQRRGSLGPLIEVDDLSAEMRQNLSHDLDRTNNDDSDARARQLEADEMLARELQEQLYNEMPVVGGHEIDENVAWEMQQEWDVFRSASGGSHSDTHRRGSSVTHSSRQPRSRSSHNSSIRRATQAQAPTSNRMAQLMGAQARVPTSSRIAQLRNRISRHSPSGSSSRRNLHFPSYMDLDMRLDILEALEAAVGDLSDMSMANHAFQVQRDFNENDYEMLLALDDNNHHHAGASVNQINCLPQSTVQTDTSEEACAICLEIPAIGETIRHLPCLHKFHKDCIDPWLSRRTSCPVCKSSIT